MNGRLMSVDIVLDSSILAFSAASFRRWSAIGSLERSMPWSRLNSPTIQSMTRWSKSSPPRCVSPFVDFTSNCATFDVVQLEDGDVVRAAAEVEDGDLFVFLLIETVRERCRGRLVDDAQDFEAGDLAGVLGRLSLRVVEIRGHGDDGLGHLVAEVVLGRLLHLLEDHRRDLGRRVSLALDFDGGEIVRAGDDLVRNALDLVRDLADRRPMKRLIEKTVFCGLVTACRLATWPTSRSPSFVKPTTDGVVRPPSALGMTIGSPPSMTATTEFVVPRSMPMTLSAIASSTDGCWAAAYSIAWDSAEVEAREGPSICAILARMGSR